MIEVNKQSAVVASKTDHMRLEIDFAITIGEKIHDLQVQLFYDENDDSHVDRRITGYKVDDKPVQEAWFDFDSETDFGPDLSDALHEWFGMHFGTDYEDIELNNVSDKIWEIIEEENLV